MKFLLFNSTTTLPLSLLFVYGILFIFTSSKLADISLLLTFFILVFYIFSIIKSSRNYLLIVLLSCYYVLSFFLAWIVFIASPLIFIYSIRKIASLDKMKKGDKSKKIVKWLWAGVILFSGLQTLGLVIALFN